MTYIEGGADRYLLHQSWRRYGHHRRQRRTQHCNHQWHKLHRHKKLLIKQTDGTYKTPDGKIKGAMENTDMVLYDADHR